MNGEAAPSESGTFFTRVIWVFLSPKKLFEDIAHNDVHWWQPWVWVSAINMVIAYIGLPIQQRLASLNPQNLTDEQLQQNLEGLEKFGFLGIIASPVIVLISSWIIVSVSYVVLNVLAEKGAKFKTYLATYLYASIVSSVGLLLGTVLTRMKGLENVRSIQDATPSFGPSLLVSADQKVLHSIMSSLDLFDVWFYVLVGLGAMTAFGLSKRSAAIAVLPVWLIFVLLTLITVRLSG